MRLGELIENIVEIITSPIKPLADAINNFIKDFADTLKRGIQLIIEQLETDITDDLEKILPADILESPLYKEWKEYAKQHAGKKPAVMAVLIPALIGSAVGTGVGMGLGGFGTNIQGWFNRRLTPTPLPPDITAYAYHTNRITEKDMDFLLDTHGYKDSYHQILYDYYKPKLSVSQIAEAFLRGVITEQEFKDKLKEHGFNENDINALSQLIWDYPSPTDFIRFSVRDVFTKDKKIKEALMAEFPEDIVDKAEKAGLKKEHLMWYWMAHWELPSPTQVYEMLHRFHPDVLKVRGEAYKSIGLDVEKLKMTLDDVKTYLRQADYDVRWRERLVGISYSPLTRVDLRRIYTLGLIDDNELKARLMEIGYTAKDAELLMAFYHNLKAEEAREWTKSEIRNLLYYGLINDTEAKVMLERLGYSEEDAKLLIDLWKAKITEKDMRETQRYIRDAYALGQITRTEAEAQLRACGLSENVIKVVLDKEEKRRLSSQRLPSASTIVKWLKLGIITKDVAIRLLKRINVADDVIDYYIKEAEVS